jgi:beta-lactamase regulating signal transducer with metallopeptidase domain
VLELAIVLAFPAAVLVPHLLPLHRIAPVTAAAIWLLALTLRAAMAIGACVFLFVYLPQTELFHALSHWCLHAVLPLLALHLAVPHSVGDLAVILPGLTLAASLLWVIAALARAAFALKLFVRRHARGRGPLGSTIVAEEGVLVAVTGLGRPRIVVSQAALQRLDDEELAASLAHELGHVRRRHRPLLVGARLLGALGRPLPGTRAAERELIFSLERDADEYAVRETRDPLALASAICKAAETRVAPSALSGLHGHGRVGLRLEYLVSDGRRPAGRALERTARALLVALAVMALGLVVSVPALAFAAPEVERAAGHLDQRCPD